MIRGRRALAPLWRARGDGSDAHQLPPGTPSFFVNGRRHHGAYDTASLAAAVSAARARASRPGTATWLDRRVNGADRTCAFLVDRGRRILIGCTITGSELTDSLHAATIAVVGEAPLGCIRHAVPPLPTRSAGRSGLAASLALGG